MNSPTTHARDVNNSEKTGYHPGQSSTPLRNLSTLSRSGCHVLSVSNIAYRDGGESRVLELLQQAHDVSSTSDELAARVATWPERYHLDSARAHVLRPLELRPNLRVLEIGAGCGGITRILGERCGLVDAVEPMPERAACIRERTRDLQNVEVFIGILEDIPPAATYDVVVVMGVLEYVGRGSSSRVPYAEFLRGAAMQLRPGGTLIVGTENRLGVKYFCGAPEDHSNRAFESIEGYDQRSPARTFGRRELENLVREAGLRPTTLGLFPDYKLTRLLYADALLEQAPQLAARIPTFPSPDWQGGPARVANEARVWANLVASGLGAHTPNSFLVLGHAGEGPSPLWRQELLGAYYPPIGRRMTYALETLVERHEGETRFTRRPLVETEPGGTIRLAATPSTLIEGEDLIVVMSRSTTDEEVATLLHCWLDALDQALVDAVLPPMDLVPHNALLTSEGSISFVEAKWDSPEFDRHAIVARGAIETAARLALATSTERWDCATLEDLTLHIGAMLHLSPSSGWLAPALDREASFQATISISPAADQEEADQTRRFRDGLAERMAQPLAALVGVGPSAESLAQRVDAAEATAIVAETAAAAERGRTGDLEAQLAVAATTAATLGTELDALRQTRMFRYSAVPRRIYRRLRRS